MAALISASPAALAMARDYPLDRNPAAVYLSSLSRTGRATMRSSLDIAAELLTRGRVRNALMLDWPALRFQHVAALRAKLIERYSPATVNKLLAAVRGVMKAAWLLGYIDAETYQHVKSVKGVAGHALLAGRALKPAEIDALIRACAADASPAGARDGALIVLLRAGGLRRAEICALKVSDFDGVNKTLVVRGKGNKQRELPANANIVAALEDWLLARGAAVGPLFCPVNKSGRVNVRQRLTPQSIYNALAKRAQQARLKHLSPHDFRRTFVSDLLDAGADISTVQKLAGHASVTTTQKYDRRGEAAKRKAVELLNVPYIRRASAGNQPTSN
ncbi:MAG TPA: tyrosine-type recombinase/integrase [Anaerolineae bacterium]